MNETYDYKDVLSRLPHNYPMLMVDGIERITDQGCTAFKNISFSELCFQGHFPGQPVFPGVLIVEALAQTCGIYLKEEAGDGVPIFAGIVNTRFYKPVYPGDQMYMQVERTDKRRRFHSFQAVATVKDTVVCKATLTIYI